MFVRDGVVLVDRRRVVAVGAAVVVGVVAGRRAGAVAARGVADGAGVVLEEAGRGGGVVERPFTPLTSIIWLRTDVRRGPRVPSDFPLSES